VFDESCKAPCNLYERTYIGDCIQERWPLDAVVAMVAAAVTVGHTGFSSCTYSHSFLRIFLHYFQLLCIDFQMAI
jgi:hypothetical protein